MSFKFSAFVFAFGSFEKAPIAEVQSSAVFLDGLSDVENEMRELYVTSERDENILQDLINAALEFFRKEKDEFYIEAFENERSAKPTFYLRMQVIDYGIHYSVR